MQEEMESKTVALIINSAKLSGRILQAEIGKLLAARKQKHAMQKNTVHHGKQTVKELVGQDQGATSVEIEDRYGKDFERIARKYGVDYAIQKVKDQPRFIVFFKARDQDALNAAFAEFTAHRMREKRPSVRRQIRALQAARSVRRPSPERHRHQELGR